jgi:hypothetical protein
MHAHRVQDSARLKWALHEHHGNGQALSIDRSTWNFGVVCLLCQQAKDEWPGLSENKMMY